MRSVHLWWSSGKDSAWALHTLREADGFDVTGLVTTVTPRFGRVAIHGTRIEILEAQAEAAGLPLTVVELPWPCSNDEYVEAVRPHLRTARDAGVDAMAFGDLFLADVRAYREELLEGSGIEPVFPLWERDTTELASAIVASGVEAFVVSLDPERVERALAGARYDRAFLDALPEGVDPCGENGEFHTVVAAGPMLAERIALRSGEAVERDGFVYADFTLDGSTGRRR